MPSVDAPGNSPQIFDASAIEAFASDIGAAVPMSVHARIVSADGNPVWSSDLVESDRIGELKRALDIAEDAPVPRGYAVFDYPLNADLMAGLRFRLYVKSLQPPNAAELEKNIRPLLQCLGRQMDVDVTITSRFDASKIEAARPGLTHRLAALQTSNSLHSDLEKLATETAAALDVVCVGIAAKGLKTPIVSTSSHCTAGEATEIMARMHASLRRNRAPVAARILLESGDELGATCAPVLSGKGTVVGCAMILKRSSARLTGRDARTLASAIGTRMRNHDRSLRPLNRSEFLARIDQLLVDPGELPISVLYLDVDNTHAVNAAFGFRAGDRALDFVRRTLSDKAAEGGVAAHLGGDRFAMFLSGSSSVEALTCANDLLERVSGESVKSESRSIDLTASIGVAEGAGDALSGEDLLNLAELAARSAKGRGGNQALVYEQIDASMIQRRDDVDRIGLVQMALLDNKFRLHAQKIQALDPGGNHKYELLLRMMDGEQEIARPSQFLSAAERYKMMGVLDRWVIDAALESIRNAPSMEASLSSFCINISAQSLLDETFVEHVESRIADTRVPTDSLCFELTETAMVRNIERAQHFIQRMHAIGCQVALDDFGTGYSSYAYLKQLPVDFLKIDGIFVRDALENELSRTIVASLVKIANVIGASTVAEHVEDESTRDWLREVGVDYVQGFLVHRPEDFDQVLADMDSVQFGFEDSVEAINLTLNNRIG